MKTYAWLMSTALMLAMVTPSMTLAANNAETTLESTSNTVAATNSGVVNLNTADAASLETIKGLGATKAQAIVNYRNQHGNFASVADVAKVPGIGPKLLTKIQADLTV